MKGLFLKFSSRLLSHRLRSPALPELFLFGFSSEEEFVVSDNETEPETDADSNGSDFGSNRGGRRHASAFSRRPQKCRQSSRKRRRPKWYSDDEEEETDDEVEEEMGRLPKTLFFFFNYYCQNLVTLIHKILFSIYFI